MSKREPAGKVERGGTAVACTQCGGDEFWRRDGLLCTRALSFFGTEGLNPTTDCYICTNCRHIEWFLGEREMP